MIKSVSYQGGLHGEFIISQIQEHYPTKFWSNLRGRSYLWNEMNRYKVYYNNNAKIKALSAWWDEQDVLDFYEKFVDDRTFIVRDHRPAMVYENFDNLVIYPDTYDYYMRKEKLLHIKTKNTDGSQHDISEMPEEKFDPKMFLPETAKYALPISKFFSLEGLNILEDYFEIRYSQLMMDEIKEYFDRDEKLIWSMSS